MEGASALFILSLVMSSEAIINKAGPSPLTPETSGDSRRRAARLESRHSPFRGMRGKWYYLYQIFQLIFFLPGWFSAREAKKIVATGKGRVYGYNDIIYMYPLLPVTLLFTLIGFQFDSPMILQVLGIAWVLLFLIILTTIAEDIDPKLVGLAAGGFIALAVAWIVLQVTGSVDINEGMWQFLVWFEPEFSPGIAMLLAVGILLLLIYSKVKSRVHQILDINGNRWSPSRLHAEATFDSVNHRIYARTPDWLERGLFGCRDIVIVPILEAHGTSEELAEKAVFSLQNVPAGGWIYAAIESSASATEVETSGA